MQTLIFDFGNVVGFFDHALTLRRLTPYTDMSAREMFEAVYNSELEDAFESGRIDVDEFLDAFRELCRLRCDVTHLTRSVADIFRPNPEICGLLPRLKGRYRLLLGSNTNPLHSEQFLPQFADEMAHFDALILSYEIGVRKPKEGFFKHCVRWANCPAEECLFIDDLPANIEGARAAGLQGVVYAPGTDFLKDFGITLGPENAEVAATPESDANGAEKDEAAANSQEGDSTTVAFPLR